MVPRIVVASLLLGILCLVSTLQVSDAGPSQAQKVEAMVQEAADLVNAKGEAAFPEFRKKGSKWLGREHYIFIFDEKGLELVNGGFPPLEGKNLWDRKDASGKYVVRDQVAMIKAKGSGWIETPWPKPGQTKETKCRTFLKGVTVGGKLLIIGAPLYLE